MGDLFGGFGLLSNGLVRGLERGDFCCASFWFEKL